MPSPQLEHAAASTRTPQEVRIARLLRSIQAANAAGQVTTTVRLVDLEALICILALSDGNVRPIMPRAA